MYTNGQINGNGIKMNGDGHIMKKVNHKRKEAIDLLSTDTYTYEIIKDTADYLLEKTTVRPRIGIICGSGMSAVAESVTRKEIFPYEEIPNFPVSTVEGHVGRLIFGYLEDIPVVCMQGRFHYFEGYPLWKCAMPVRVMKLLGVTHLLASNAAGSLNPNFKVGDIMILKDHISFMGFAGNNPLQGVNDERFGPRFPSMSRAYDKGLIQAAKNIAKDMKTEYNVHEGVYTCLGGPNFETVAELKLLKMVGVDTVGMSTVHEVITARHCDLTVFAFSLITNVCVVDYDVDEEPNHVEVMDVGRNQTENLSKFIKRLVIYINENSRN